MTVWFSFNDNSSIKKVSFEISKPTFIICILTEIKQKLRLYNMDLQFSPIYFGKYFAFLFQFGDLAKLSA